MTQLHLHLWSYPHLAFLTCPLLCLIWICGEYLVGLHQNCPNRTLPIVSFSYRPCLLKPPFWPPIPKEANKNKEDEDGLLGQCRGDKGEQREMRDFSTRYLQMDAARAAKYHRNLPTSNVVKVTFAAYRQEKKYLIPYDQGKRRRETGRTP